MIMKTKLRKIGNSSGVILSKRVLQELNIEPTDELQIAVRDGQILIQKIAESRSDWKEQFIKNGSLEDAAVEMEFSNKFDEEEWTW